MKDIAYLLTFIILSFIGCSGTTMKNSGLSQQEKVTIMRFDKDVYNYLQQPDAVKESGLKDKYPLLLPAFGRIAMDNSDPMTFFPALRDYFSHPALMQIYKDALNTFDNVTHTKKSYPMYLHSYPKICRRKNYPDSPCMYQASEKIPLS